MAQTVLERFRGRGAQQFPPQEWLPVYDKYRLWAALYSGDPNRLSDAYSSMVYTPTPKGSFWAKHIKDERQTMIHVPVAGDIATVSADLLFSESPTISVSKEEPQGEQTNDRLREITEQNDFQAVLLEAAETAAAMGGVFVKVNWDRDLYDYPIFSIAQVDSALPVFQWGMLQKVGLYKIIHEELRDNELTVWRHGEIHERGVIHNKLYVGTRNTLGHEVSLESNPYTTGMEPTVETGIDDILIRYIPNRRPNKLWRGSALGQSDYAGLEGMMDSLDEVYTSWIRDLRLAKSRIIVPETFLEFDTEENRRYFDAERSAYQGMNMGPAGDGQQITMNQFAIRAEEHRETALNFLDRIIATAGYSPQSFGLNIEGRADSGTALRVRERKSLKTQGKKQRYFRKPIEDLLHLVLVVDNMLLGNRGTNLNIRPRVSFADGIPDDPHQMADSLQKINQAEAMSIQTKVEWLHPDWDESQVEEEVKRIKQEKGMDVPDIPMALPGDE